MIRKIVIVQVTPVYKSFIRKWCIDEIPRLGYKAQILDLSPVLRPELYNLSKNTFSDEDINLTDVSYTVIETYKSMDEFFRMNHTAFFFVTFSNFYYERHVFSLLKKYKINYANLSGISSELGIEDITDIAQLKDRISIEHIHHAIYNRLLRRFNNYQPQYLAISSKMNERYQIKINMYKNIDKILRIHSYDYENYLRTVAYNNDSRPYCVFLDSYVPFHPDFVIDQNRKIDPDGYYKEISDIFDGIEKELDLEIIIAAHPRANEEIERKYFGRYKIFYGMTSELVKGADLVLSHFSNSIAFGIMAYKPIVIINNASISKVDLFSRRCMNYAEKLSLKLIRNREDISTDITEVDISRYHDFIGNVITYQERKAPCFWNLIISEAEKAGALISIN